MFHTPLGRQQDDPRTLLVEKYGAKLNQDL
jgi:hypothetical protein